MLVKIVGPLYESIAISSVEQEIQDNVKGGDTSASGQDRWCSPLDRLACARSSAAFGTRRSCWEGKRERDVAVRHVRRAVARRHDRSAHGPHGRHDGLELSGDELFLEAGLAYPIRDGIPIMLPEEARKLVLEGVERARKAKV